MSFLLFFPIFKKETSNSLPDLIPAAGSLLANWRIRANLLVALTFWVLEAVELVDAAGAVEMALSRATSARHKSGKPRDEKREKIFETYFFQLFPYNGIPSLYISFRHEPNPLKQVLKTKRKKRERKSEKRRQKSTNKKSEQRRSP